MRKHFGKTGDSKRLIIILAVAVVLAFGVFSTFAIASSSGSSSGSGFGGWLKNLFSGSSPTGRATYEGVDLPPGVIDECPASMVSYWKFEGNASDKLGRYDGVAKGTPAITFPSIGIIGSCMETVSENYVEIPDVTFWNGFTIEAWIRPPLSAIPGFAMYLVDFGATNYDDHQIYVEFDETFDFERLTKEPYSPDGKNIRFYTKTTPPPSIQIFKEDDRVPHYMARWDPDSRTAGFWVRVPDAYTDYLYVGIDTTDHEGDGIWYNVPEGSTPGWPVGGKDGVFDYDREDMTHRASHLAVIAASENTHCAIDKDGGVKCNSRHGGTGKFGEATCYDPGVIKPKAIAVDTAAYRTCFLLADGNVKCQGKGKYGSYGGPNGELPYSFYDLSDYNGEFGPAVALSLSGDISCVALENGELYCWDTWHVQGTQGDNDPGDLRINHTFENPSCSNFISLDVANELCGLTFDGDICCKGYAPVPQADKELIITNAVGVGTGTLADLAGVIGSMAYVCGLKSDGWIMCRFFEDFDEFEEEVKPYATSLFWGIGTLENDIIGLSVSNDVACGLRLDGNITCHGRVPKRGFTKVDYKANALGFDIYKVPKHPDSSDPGKMKQCVLSTYEDNAYCRGINPASNFDEVFNPFRIYPDVDTELKRIPIVEKGDAFELSTNYDTIYGRVGDIDLQVTYQSHPSEYADWIFTTLTYNINNLGGPYEVFENVLGVGAVTRTEVSSTESYGGIHYKEVQPYPLRVPIVSDKITIGKHFIGKIDEVTLHKTGRYHEGLKEDWNKVVNYEWDYCAKIVSKCGNGELEYGEECDPGEIDKTNKYTITHYGTHCAADVCGCPCTECRNDTNYNGVADALEKPLGPQWIAGMSCWQYYDNVFYGEQVDKVTGETIMLVKEGARAQNTDAQQTEPQMYKDGEYVCAAEVDYEPTNADDKICQDCFWSCYRVNKKGYKYTGSAHDVTFKECAQLAATWAREGNPTGDPIPVPPFPCDEDKEPGELKQAERAVKFYCELKPNNQGTITKAAAPSGQGGQSMQAAGEFGAADGEPEYPKRMCVEHCLHNRTTLIWGKPAMCAPECNHIPMDQATERLICCSACCDRKYEEAQSQSMILPNEEPKIEWSQGECEACYSLCCASKGGCSTSRKRRFCGWKCCGYIPTILPEQTFETVNDEYVEACELTFGHSAGTCIKIMSLPPGEREAQVNKEDCVRTCEIAYKEAYNTDEVKLDSCIGMCAELASLPAEAKYDMSKIIGMEGPPVGSKDEIVAGNVPITGDITPLDPKIEGATYWGCVRGCTNDNNNCKNYVMDGTRCEVHRSKRMCCMEACEATNYKCNI